MCMYVCVCVYACMYICISSSLYMSKFYKYVSITLILAHQFKNIAVSAATMSMLRNLRSYCVIFICGECNNHKVIIPNVYYT